MNAKTKKYGWVAGVFVLTVVLAAEASMSRDEIILAFAEANRAFQQANESTQDPQQARRLYEQAILGYEKIIEDGGIQNAKLYYNLANAYMLSEDLGRAILNYRRARRLAPEDPKILKNLNFARSRRIDQIPVPAEKRVLSRLFFWHYEWSLKTRLRIGGLSLALLCLWLTVRTWTSRLPAVPALYVVLLAIVIGMAGSIAGRQVTGGRMRDGVIITPSVVARQGDGMNYAESFTEPLHAGTEFELMQRRGGWLQIRLADGSEAWILDSAAELI